MRKLFFSSERVNFPKGVPRRGNSESYFSRDLSTSGTNYLSEWKLIGGKMKRVDAAADNIGPSGTKLNPNSSATFMNVKKPKY